MSCCCISHSCGIIGASNFRAKALNQFSLLTLRPSCMIWLCITGCFQKPEADIRLLVLHVLPHWRWFLQKCRCSVVLWSLSIVRLNWLCISDNYPSRWAMYERHGTNLQVIFFSEFRLNVFLRNACYIKCTPFFSFWCIIWLCMMPMSHRSRLSVYVKSCMSSEDSW